MAPINTSYDEMEEGFPGLLLDSGFTDKVTYVQGEASAEIPFGAVVAEGTPSVVSGTPDDGILMVDGASKIAGVLVHSHNYTPGYGIGAVGVKPKQTIAVMRRGRIWALAEPGTYAKGAQVFVRHTASGGNTQKGAVRPDANTATAVVVKGITVHRAKTLTATGYIAVEVDIPANRT